MDGIQAIGQYQNSLGKIQSTRDSMKTAGAEVKKEKLLEKCHEFESIFIKQMLDSMRKTVPEKKLLDGGMAEDVFQDMLYDKYAMNMSKSANLGIAKMLYNQMSSYV